MSRRHRRSSSRRARSRRSASLSGLRLIGANRNNDEPVVLHLLDFEITDEPIPDPALNRLRPEDRDRIMEAGSKVMEGAADQVRILERLAQEFPTVPKVYNFLMVAYNNAGQYDKAEECAEDTYCRFPNYLFGMANYAHTLLRRGLVRQVGEILQNRFSIHLWITNRKRYHVSEFVSFNGLMARYFAATGEYEVAERYYKMLLEVAPDHPGTQQIGGCLHPEMADRLLSRLTEWVPR